MSSPRRPKGQAPRYFTTHQVATYLGVSIATVVNWERQGRIVARRTPGGHRRIALHELLRFCRDNDYPLPAELALAATVQARVPQVLVVHGRPDFAELLRDYLLLDSGIEVRLAEGALQAGFALAAQVPDLVVLDLDHAEVSPEELEQLDFPEGRAPRVVGTTSLRSALHDRLVESGVLTEVLEPGGDLQGMVTQLRALLSAR